MSTDRASNMGCVAAALLTIVIVFIPIIGHIVLTVMILTDDMTTGEKILWLAFVWVVWVIGPFLYLLLGQRRNRVFAALT